MMMMYIMDGGMPIEESARTVKNKTPHDALGVWSQADIKYLCAPAPEHTCHAKSLYLPFHSSGGSIILYLT
jgi:hypothetical protein